MSSIKTLKQNITRISSKQKEKKLQSFNFKIHRNVINASFYRFVDIFFYTYKKFNIILLLAYSFYIIK